MISFVFGFGWSFAVVAGFAFHVDRLPNAFFLTRFLGAKSIGVCRVVHVLLLLVHVRLCGERGVSVISSKKSVSTAGVLTVARHSATAPPSFGEGDFFPAIHRRIFAAAFEHRHEAIEGRRDFGRGRQHEGLEIAAQA